MEATHCGAVDEDEETFVTQHWKLRTMAREATLREVANGKLRRLLAYSNRSITQKCMLEKPFYFINFRIAGARYGGAARRGALAF